MNHDGTVKIGSQVSIRDGQLEEAWRIVAAHDADAQRWQLSEEAPLARALVRNSCTSRRSWPRSTASRGAGSTGGAGIGEAAVMRGSVPQRLVLVPYIYTA